MKHSIRVCWALQIPSVIQFLNGIGLTEVEKLPMGELRVTGMTEDQFEKFRAEYEQKEGDDPEDAVIADFSMIDDDGEPTESESSERMSLGDILSQALERRDGAAL